MKKFTEEQDVRILHDDRNNIDYPVIHCNMDSMLMLHAPLVWQELRMQETRSGYGSKLTTEYKIHYRPNGHKVGRLYRIYATCWSNTSTYWFRANKVKIILS